MAGRILFENGPHASRVGYRGEFTEADMEALRSAAPSYVSDEALFGIASKIMFTVADAKRGDAYVATRDQLAQLKRLLRLAKRHNDDTVTDANGRKHCFVALAYALANLDQGTLELIQAAERGAIRAVVDRAGVFLDVDDDEHYFVPPTIQIMRPFTRSAVTRTIERVDEARRPVYGAWNEAMCPARVWLPRGVEGFIESVEQVKAGLEELQDAAGRQKKTWQDDLAKVVVEFWQAHCPNEPQGANYKKDSDWCSPMVSFAGVVFRVAGELFSHERRPLSKVRLARLLHENKKKLLGGQK